MINQDHIWELCGQHDITVRWHRGRAFSEAPDGSYYGQAKGTREIVLGWQAEGEDPYWVALHEIAHIVLPEHLGLPHDPTGTAKEANCWMWALEQARTPPSLDQVSRMLMNLKSYVRSWGFHPRVDEVLEAYCEAAGW